MGADDYIAKPFSQRLLIARIRAILRRAELGAGRARTASRRGRRPATDRSAAGWRWTRRATGSPGTARPVSLTVTEFLILEALAAAPRRDQEPQPADGRGLSATTCSSTTARSTATSSACAASSARSIREFGGDRDALRRRLQLRRWLSPTARPDRRGARAAALAALGASLTARILAVNIIAAAAAGGQPVLPRSLPQAAARRTLQAGRGSRRRSPPRRSPARRGQRQEALLVQIGKEQQLRLRHVRRAGRAEGRQLRARRAGVRLRRSRRPSHGPQDVARGDRPGGRLRSSAPPDPPTIASPTQHRGRRLARTGRARASRADRRSSCATRPTAPR